MRKLHSIQSLRAIAAMLVVADHALSEWTSPPVKQAAMQLGAIGVQIFFVISGFIMIHSQYQEFGRDGAPWRFLLRRMVRIMPMYWLFTFAVAANLIRRHESLTTAQLLKSLFFIPWHNPLSNNLIVPLLNQGWTLYYEMFFYFIFASCLFLRRTRGLILLSLLFLGWVLAGSIVKPLTDTSLPDNAFEFWTRPIILLFIAGLWIGWATENYGWADARIPFPLTICAALITAIMVMFVLFVGRWQGPFIWLLLVWSICIACVWLGVFDTRPNRFNAFMNVLGNASFSTYLVHVFVLQAARRAYSLFFSEFHPWIFVPATVIAANLAGYLIYRFVERPVTHLGQSMLSRKISPRPA